MEKVLLLYRKLTKVNRIRYIEYISIILFAALFSFLFQITQLQMLIALGIFPLYVFCVKHELKGLIIALIIIDFLFIFNVIFQKYVDNRFIYHLIIGNIYFLSIGYLLITWKKISEKMFAIINQIQFSKKTIPICAKCKSVRGEKNEWDSIENFLHKIGNHELTHGYCPKCFEHIIKDI